MSKVHTSQAFGAGDEAGHFSFSEHALYAVASEKALIHTVVTAVRDFRRQTTLTVLLPIADPAFGWYYRNGPVLPLSIPSGDLREVRSKFEFG